MSREGPVSAGREKASSQGTKEGSKVQPARDFLIEDMNFMLTRKVKARKRRKKKVIPEKKRGKQQQTKNRKKVSIRVSEEGK